MKFEGIPEGWELVRIGEPKDGEMFINGVGGVQKSDGYQIAGCAIVRKIAPFYRPFANAEEFEPNRERWFRHKASDVVGKIGSYGPIGVHSLDGVFATYKELLEKAVFDDDGTPCGVEVKE